MNRAELAAFWDDHVARWRAGSDELPPPLDEYFASYAGKGRGAVTRDGFVEPYQGDLLGRVHDPRLPVLGLNPGRYHPGWQARDGAFAEEIAELGSYTSWAATAPYFRPEWTDTFGPNRYFVDRLRFSGRWLGIDDPVPNNLLVFELYPWHSTGVTGPMRPRPELIDEFVWQPIAEVGSEHVFAFGKDWNAIAESLRLPLVGAFGAGGSDFGSAVASRSVRAYGLPSGQRLVIEWHSGSAGPPNAAETELLRAALGG